MKLRATNEHANFLGAVLLRRDLDKAGLPRTTRRLLAEDLIGSVGQLDVSLYVNWADAPGSHYVTEPHMSLTDMGIHHFDMMRYT